MAGHMVHIEIPADDSAAARSFWSGLFGWQFQPAPGVPDYQMARLTEDTGAAVSGMEPGKRGMLTYFDVDDIGVGVARVRELGGTSSDQMPVPGMGWFATCTDPHGNDFGLWQSDPGAPAPSA